MIFIFDQKIESIQNNKKLFKTTWTKNISHKDNK